MKGLTKHQAASIVSATTEDAKVKAAAEVMVERPLDLIKHILMKHEQAVIEVMREQQQQINALMDALKDIRMYLGPATPPCCEGCSYEWTKALEAVNATLAQHGGAA